MENRISLHIYHRNRLFRDCLASVLSGLQNIEAISHDLTGGTGCSEAWSAGRRHVALIDMHLPDAFAVKLIQAVTKSPLEAKVIVLVSVNDPETLVHCISAGATGCLLEEASLAELDDAIQRILRGETFCSPQLMTAMFDHLAERSHSPLVEQAADEVHLTRREREVLALLADRMSNQEIATELDVSLYTVKNHVHNILEKLQVNDRFDAIDYARQKRLVPRLGISSRR